MKWWRCEDVVGGEEKKGEDEGIYTLSNQELTKVAASEKYKPLPTWEMSQWLGIAALLYP